jgi:hypothetical protein
LEKRSPGLFNGWGERYDKQASSLSIIRSVKANRLTLKTLPWQSESIAGQAQKTTGRTGGRTASFQAGVALKPQVRPLWRAGRPAAYFTMFTIIHERIWGCAMRISHERLQHSRWARNNRLLGRHGEQRCLQCPSKVEELPVSINSSTASTTIVRWP